MTLLGAWAGASVVGLALGMVLLARQRAFDKPSRPSAILRSARRLRSRLAGHQLIDMGGALLPYLLPLVVTARLSASDNAYFYTTWMMTGVFLIVSPAVSQSLFAEGAHNPEELIAKARSALTVIGALLVPGVIAVFVLGGVLLSAFGPAYDAHAIGLLRIALLAAFPDAITNVYVAVLRVRVGSSPPPGSTSAWASGSCSCRGSCSRRSASAPSGGRSWPWSCAAACSWRSTSDVGTR